MAGLDITIDLGDALETAMDRAIAGAEDMTRPMAEISEVLVEGAHRNFASESNAHGVPWKQSQRAREDGGKTLHQTGALERAIVPEYGRDYAMAGVLRTAGPAIYAGIHQDGGEIRPREKKALSFAGRIVAKVVMPRRQYLDFGPWEETQTVDILGDFLRGLFGQGAVA